MTHLNGGKNREVTLPYDNWIIC